jgi:hypothetical protein
MRWGWVGVCLGLGICISCIKAGGGGGRRSASNDAGSNGPPGNNTPTLTAGLAEATLTAGIAIPNEGPELVEPPIDESITLMEPAASSEPQPIEPGQVITVEIPFEAPNGNVVAAGIRFGDEGPIRQIQIPEAEGETSNVLNFQFEVPADICDDLADICHDIVCYEFAVTDVGEISAANIMQLGLVCGDGCNEPTCQQLLMCEMPAEPDAGGNVTPPDPMVDLDWGEVTINGTTLAVDGEGWDAPCTDATGETTWYTVTNEIDSVPFVSLRVFGPPAPGESVTAESDEVIASTGATCFIPHFEEVEFCPDGVGDLAASETCETYVVTGGTITASADSMDKTDPSGLSGTYYHYTFTIDLEGGGTVSGDFYGEPSYGTTN